MNWAKHFGSLYPFVCPSVACIFCLMTTAAWAAPGRVTDGLFAQTEGHVSLLSGESQEMVPARAFGLSLKSGWGWGRWRAFVQAESTFWNEKFGDEEEIKGALNVGVGGEVLYGGGFVRTSLSAGPSILLFASDVDEGGEVGMFVDVRPAGLRWALGEGFGIGLDPISLALVMPVLSGIPLVELQYRTTVVGEYTF